MLVIYKDLVQAYEGIVNVRTLPQDWNTEEIFLKYWPKMTPSEKDRYGVASFHNLITTAGLLAINSFLGNTSTITGFSKYLALGNGSISAPSAGDTGLVNEVFRKQPSVLTIIGNISTITTYLASTDCQFVLTEAGLFTGSASGTLGSGVLATHLLFPWNNVLGVPIAVDYSIVRN